MAYPTIVTNGCFQRPPAVDSFACAPTVTDGEVTEIYLSDQELLAEDLADAAAFLAKIDSTPDAAGDVARIKVTGKLTVTPPATTRVEGGSQVRSGKFGFLIEVEQFNDTDINYEAIRSIQYGGKPMKLWYRIGEKLYGGDAEVHEGISANIIAYQGAEGAGTLAKNILSASWESKLQPKRMAHPLA